MKWFLWTLFLTTQPLKAQDASRLFFRPSEIKELEKAAADPQASEEVLGKLGHAYFLKSDYERSRRYLLRALKLRPQKSSTLRLLAQLETHVGDCPQALTYFAKIPAQEMKQDPYLLLNKGKCLFQLKKKKEAASLFGQALGLDQKMNVQLELATFYFEQEQLTSARFHFQKIHQQHPEALLPNYYLGRIALREQRKGEAKAHLQSFLKASAKHSSDDIQQKRKIAESFLKSL